MWRTEIAGREFGKSDLPPDRARHGNCAPVNSRVDVSASSAGTRGDEAGVLDLRRSA